MGLTLPQLILIFAAGLAVSAAFSMLEAALLSQDRHRLRHLAARDNREAKRMLRLLGRSDQLLSAILLCNNLANVMCATTAAVIVARLTGGENESAVFAATLAVTFIILVFGEIAPKVVGVRHSQRLSLRCATPVFWLVRGLRPLVWVALSFASAFLGIFGMRTKFNAAGDAMMDTKELRSVVLASGKGITETHRQLLLRLLELDNVKVEDVMSPRQSVYGINLADGDAAMMRTLRRARHSHLPVFSDNLDGAEGFVKTSEALKMAGGRGRIGRAEIRGIMQKIKFIPAASTVLRQIDAPDFADLRRALVVDGYGRVVGLATNMDFAAALVDSIPVSRHRKAAITPTPSGGYATEGAVLMRDLADKTEKEGLVFPPTSARTLNGLILEHLGDIPEAPASVQIGNVRFELVKVEPDNILQVRLEKTDSPEEDPSEEDEETLEEELARGD